MLEFVVVFVIILIYIQYRIKKYKKDIFLKEYTDKLMLNNTKIKDLVSYAVDTNMMVKKTEIRNFFKKIDNSHNFEDIFIIDIPVALMHNETKGVNESINVNTFKVEKISDIHKIIPSTTKSILIYEIQRHRDFNLGSAIAVRMYFSDDVLKPV